jgi:SAM-dependent methyltransferase
VPLLSRIFAGMESLGSSPRAIVPLLRRLELVPACERRGDRRGRVLRALPWRVLDLACGKGDLAITLARRLGTSCVGGRGAALGVDSWRVVGIDACGEFIEHARERATRLGVEHLCEFRVASISATMRPGRGVLAGEGAFDAAMMIGLWGVERAAPLLSRLVRPGGVYVIDDAFAVDERAAHRHGAATLGDAVRFVGERGGEVLHAALVPRRSVRASNQRTLARLSRNARELARERRALRPALAEFIRRQRAASRLLERGLRPGLLLARRPL